MQLLSVSADEEVAVSMSEGSESFDHHIEEAQKATPVLPHFQYTRVNFKLHIIVTPLFVYRDVYSIWLGLH
jgi:hypothetical protein